MRLPFFRAWHWWLPRAAPAGGARSGCPGPRGVSRGRPSGRSCHRRRRHRAHAPGFQVHQLQFFLFCTCGITKSEEITSRRAMRPNLRKFLKFSYVENTEILHSYRSQSMAQVRCSGERSFRTPLSMPGRGPARPRQRGGSRGAAPRGRARAARPLQKRSKSQRP